MSAMERFESLRARHAQLEQELNDESHRPMPSTEIMMRLKREKLRIKDEMSRLDDDRH